MDLALELGMPYERMAQEMTERELRQWVKYARKRSLPSERIERYLAQVAWAIAVTMGGAEVGIDDFLLDFDLSPAPIEVDPEAVKAAFGFSPRK